MESSRGNEDLSEAQVWVNELQRSSSRGKFEYHNRAKLCQRARGLVEQGKDSYTGRGDQAFKRTLPLSIGEQTSIRLSERVGVSEALKTVVLELLEGETEAKPLATFTLSNEIKMPYVNPENSDLVAISFLLDKIEAGGQSDQS